ncbi:battenin isoform X1 [Anopheles coustani]|uniref:battenin isoform X1 n=1 Tax=Anopheles coustani TaxID=139045 RepID=UPI00265A080F|nr:battenin isoform X1 [Anopheles coustani]
MTDQNEASSPSVVPLTEDDPEQAPPKDKGLWRDLVAYWILGLCNNYGYVVMLTAAHDILKELEGNDGDHGKSVQNEYITLNTTARSDDVTFGYTARPCNKLSTGAILLADILPALVVKSVASFLPLAKHVRIFLCVAAAAAGFLLTAFATVEWVLFLGVIATSFSSGLGEATFLAYATYFNKNVISTWSSGTGGAGIAGSLSYTGLTELGLTPKTTILIMLVVPALEAAAFWLLLRHKDTDKPAEPEEAKEKVEEIDYSTLPEDERPLENWSQRIRYIPSLFIFMIPLILVYLLEYYINQGLFELVYFPGIWLSQSGQYRWYQVIYQIGVFISRSSVNLIQFRHVWIMAVFQFLNVVYFTFEAIYYFTPSIWIIFVLILWEGLLGGGGYVNTFYRIQTDVPAARREYAMMVTSISDSVGIALAGVAAIPSHNAICDLPVPDRLL